MRKYTFDMNNARFDNYEQHYIHTNDGFIHFNTGEFCYTRPSPDPHDRHHYPKYNVTVTSTSDLPADKYDFYHGSTKIIPAWLSHNGIQYFLIDHDVEPVRMYVLKSPHTRSDPTTRQIPQNKQRHPIYWASQNARPVADHIRYYPPFVATDEEKAYIKILTAAAKFVSKMSTTGQIQTLPVFMSPSDFRELMLEYPIPSALAAALTPRQLAAFTNYTGSGIVCREAVVVPYLTVREKAQ